MLSWIVSVYFVPYLGTVFLKTPAHIKVLPPLEGAVVSAPKGQQAFDQTVRFNATGRMAVPAAGNQPHESFDSGFYNVFRKIVNW